MARSRKPANGAFKRQRKNLNKEPSDQETPSRPQRYLLKPLAALTAILVAAGLFLGLPSAIRNWPSAWWPRNVPVVSPTVLNDPQVPKISNAPATPDASNSKKIKIVARGGGVYAVGIPADQIDSRSASLPRPAGELGCYSEPRTS